MEILRLSHPAEKDFAAIWDYRREFLENSETLHGGAGLQGAPSPEAWHKALEENRREETVAPGLVPATTLIALRQSDGLMVGIIDIRHRLNDYLLRYGGHIGYSVRKSQRQKGYASEMLHQALLLCREELHLSRVLITCNRDNAASARTILSQGGVLENEIPGEDGLPLQRYWIDLSSR
ncbi:MAG: GNAT family N-acetyltransferase [Oscillospiraceae bacterium]|nr:GNAT family N-acetyltransferase [Oscillospiraceae bacterium]